MCISHKGHIPTKKLPSSSSPVLSWVEAAGSNLPPGPPPSNSGGTITPRGGGGGDGMTL